ncbi:MAG: DUF6250 domain-containing protein [bacterium]
MPSTAAEVQEEPEGELILHEDFSDGMENWWVEGGQETWVKDGRLHMRANTEEPRDLGCVATAWHKQKISGDVRVEFQAHVIDSKIGANNINFFLFYSDPSDKPLYETRHRRTSADYSLDPDLNGYIFTFLRDRHLSLGAGPDGQPKARFRMRRCPGSELIDEAGDPMGVQEGQTYQITIERRDGTLTYSVDGEQYMQAEDDEPHESGLLGLRTFCTYLWWDNIKVYSLD